MAKYRIPRDTDVEGDLRVYSNTTIDGDLEVTGSVTTASTTKTVTTDVQVSLIQIIVNDNTVTDPINNSVWTIHVPETIDTLDLFLTAGATHDVEVYVTNETGERKDLDIRYRAEFAPKEIYYTLSDASLIAINPLAGSIPGIADLILTQATSSYASYRISYRNANLVDEVERLVHPNTIPTYRDDRDIDARFVPVGTIPGVLTPNNDPVANVQEALVGIQDNIDAVTVGVLNITADDVSITAIDGITTPNNNAQEALASLQSNIDNIGPWVAGDWTVGEKAIWDGAIYLLGVADKGPSDTDDPATDADWSELLVTPMDLNIGDSTEYIISYTTTDASVLADVTLRRSNVLHVFEQGVEFENALGDQVAVPIRRNDHIELQIPPGAGPPPTLARSELYIVTAHTVNEIPVGTTDFQTILDDTNNFLKVQVDEDSGHVEAGLLSVDTASPTSTASLGLFYGTDTSGTPDVPIDFSELENEIIANDTRLDRLDGNFHGNGLAFIDQANSITYGFGNAVLVTVLGTVTDIAVGDFIGLEGTTALTVLDDPSLLDFKLKVTAVDSITSPVSTRFTTSVVRGSGAVDPVTFVYRFLTDPADGDIVIVDANRELRNVNATRRFGIR